MNHLVVFTAATDPNNMPGRVGGYTSKVHWQDSRAITKGEAQYWQSMKSLGLHGKAAAALQSAGTGVDLGGSIEVYPSAAGAQARYRYMVSISKAVPMVADGYDYVHGAAVLRLSKYLAPGGALFPGLPSPRANPYGMPQSPHPTSPLRFSFRAAALRLSAHWRRYASADTAALASAFHSSAVSVRISSPSAVRIFLPCSLAQSMKSSRYRTSRSIRSRAVIMIAS
jgi:hypothetical protein